jgi:hypothetical protein
MTKTVVHDDKHINLASARMIMDEEIVNNLHEKYYYETDQDFFDDYIFLHQKKYGNEFILN